MVKTMEIMQIIGKAVSQQRKKLNINQETIVDYAEVSPATLSNLESGKGNISVNKLVSILEVIGLELNITEKRV
jgi:transcriptional regulator with XRE-family HTH domain